MADKNKLEQVEKALAFLGEDWGYSVTLESDGNGFGDIVIREQETEREEVYGKGNIENQSYTDAFLEAVRKARRKATRKETALFASRE